MSRLFVYDENMTDERAKITLPKLSYYYIIIINANVRFVNIINAINK